ncbi:MAG: DUF3060 domain-containing protein [Trueperaceae bacterium]
MFKQMIRVIVLGLIFVSSETLAQAVYEPEVFEFETGMGDMAASPVGILEELRARYEEKGEDLDEAGARLVPLEITLVSDMGNLDIDFTGLNVSVLSIRSGMGDINAVLPETGAISGEVVTDQGNVTLQLPNTRTLAVVESATDMGDIIIDDAVGQEVNGEGPVALTLTTGMGDIEVVSVGVVAEDAKTEATESSESTIVTTQAVIVEDATVDAASITVVGGSVAADASGNIEVTDSSFSGEAITIDGMGGEQTADCAGRNVVVNGMEITLTLTGVCNNIEINGASNTITVDAVSSIVLNGIGNDITYLYTLNGKDPSQEVVGLNNSVKRQ